MQYLLVILLSVFLGFLLSRFPLKFGATGAVLIPFGIVAVLSLFQSWLASTPSGGHPMMLVVYITVGVPSAAVALGSMLLFRKFTLAKTERQHSA